MRARLAAEAFGAFALVFCGAGAAAAGRTVAEVALVFGATVAALILLLGRTSGAHLNPAVSLAFWRAGRMSGREALGYAGAQCAGALMAGFALRAMLPGSDALGATLPVIPAWEAFALEVALSSALMLAILLVAHGASERGGFAALLIGGVVGLEAFFAGPVTGASMNPARSLGPAIASGATEGLWIYLLAPPLGMLAALPLCRAIRPRGGCCRGACA